MSSWKELWSRVGDINFDKEPYTWKFYELLLNNCSLRGKKVLEMGCGTGINSIFMAAQGAKVTFMDNSKEALRIVKKTLDKFSLNGELVCADIFENSIEKEYDIVHSEGVVEHFNRGRRQEIIEIHRDAAKRGGKVVLIVPNLKCIPYRIGKFIAEKTGTWLYGKEYPYTRSELKGRMELAGLKTGKVIGGEFLMSFGWILAPLWLSTDSMLRRGIRSSARNVVMKTNYNNFMANRYGRVIGAVGKRAK